MKMKKLLIMSLTLLILLTSTQISAFASNRYDWSKFPWVGPNHTTKGDLVYAVQMMLRAEYCDPKGIDGVYGKNTKAAVELYQSVAVSSFPIDGVVGSLTWNSLSYNVYYLYSYNGAQVCRYEPQSDYFFDMEYYPSSDTFWFRTGNGYYHEIP